MAAKKRDYKAEERRRNELAKQRGFTSRAQQRGAIKRGEAKVTRTGNTYRIARTTAKTPTKTTKTTKRGRTYRDKVQYMGYTFSKREACEDFSMISAKNENAKYRPEEAAKLGLTPSAYTHAYYMAFIDESSGYYANRYDDGGSDAMRYWFVDLDHMEADDYDDKYSANSR